MMMMLYSRFYQGLSRSANNELIRFPFPSEKDLATEGWYRSGRDICIRVENQLF